MSPYLLPEGNVQIAFSGGRTSGYMLHHILEANGGLPERAKVIFTNTGREMGETLDFVQECGGRWGVEIVWLEYRYDNGPKAERVSHNSASRSGEPFEALLDRRGFLPNVKARFCTSELKIRTAKRWLVASGWKNWTTCTGIRADEPSRVITTENQPRERWVVWQPLVPAGVTKRDVAAFWRAQPFDLRLANVNGSTPYGNCDGCFLKSEATLARFCVEHRDRAAWWIAQERTKRGAKGRGGSFSKRFTYRELQDFMDRHGPGLLDDAAHLCQADDGECTG